MLTIRLLGGASIRDSNGSASGRGAQRSRMALLALLALSRSRSVSRERLMALLWPESDTERARQSLRESLYRLRETIGDRALVSVGDEVRIDSAHVACDVWAFEEAVARKDWKEAERLYTGPLLDGVFLNNGTEFEHWAATERARLAELYAASLESLANECTTAGDFLAAGALWRRRAAQDPYNSRVALRLMAVLEASGDRAGALTHAAAHATLLKTDLGVSPDLAISELAERLRQAAPPSDARAAAFVRLEAPAAQSHASDGVLNSSRASLKSVFSSSASGSHFGKRAAYGGLTLALAVLVAAGGLRGGTAIDENRIAIVPFRTSTNDPTIASLRDGLVELLSAEFTGDVGPAAVDAGDVLRAWKRSVRAGETPTRDAALVVARQVGAAQVASGFVVGNAQRFTVSVSVLNASDGDILIAPVQVHGTLDSLPVVVAELAARIRARSAGAWRLSANEPEHTSAEVLRAYLRGMVGYRQANWAQAAGELRQAMQLDTTFVPAAYRFALIYAMLAPRTPFNERPTPDSARIAVFRRLWHQRQRLSAEQRILLESVADSTYVLWRMQALRALERTVALIPNSVEAWDILGDDYFHAGALVGLEDWKARAKRAFLRAREIDSTVAVNAEAHLADLAFVEHDAAAHAAFAKATTGPRGQAYLGYQSALLRGDSAAIRSARMRYARAWAAGSEDGLDWAFRGLTIPEQELASLVRQFASYAATLEQHESIARWTALDAMMSGRFDAGRGALQRLYGVDTTDQDEAIIEFAEHDSAAAARLMRIDSKKLARRVHPVVCNAALSRLRHGDSSGVKAILATMPTVDDRQSARDAASTIRRGLAGQTVMCAQVLRAVLASRTSDGAPVRALLFRADSMMRFTPINYGPFWNYDLALAFARHHEYAAAAAAVRRRFVDAADAPRLVIGLRHEGQWAALAGDTTAAVAAYRQYLMWRSSPNATLVPQRDSVRAELAALERRQRG